MDIKQLKTKIDTSGRKVTALGNEYLRSKDEASARKILVKIFGEISQQMLLIAEQNAHLDRKM